MDFYGCIYEVSTYLSLDFVVWRQLISDFVEKKNSANYRKVSQQLNANCFPQFYNFPLKNASSGRNFCKKNTEIFFEK